LGWGPGPLKKYCIDFRVSRWYALVYGLYGGQLAALRTDLNEPLAHALVQLAILAWLRDRRWLAVLFFALAAITKETTLIFLAAYLLFLLIDRTIGAGCSGWGWPACRLCCFNCCCGVGWGYPGSWFRRGGSHQF
jgi:hypothetical protein